MANANGPPVAGVDIEGIRDSLAQTDVAFAILFGSHARGTASESSDVDIALGFPEAMDAHDRFHARNRIDADLQASAEGFVDVADITSLPTPVAYAALRDGLILVGDDATVEAYRDEVERADEATAADRERERRAFIDRLAGGET